MPGIWKDVWLEMYGNPAEYVTGVYWIYNLANGKYYVGGAYADFKKRWGNHKWALRNNKHDNTHLQRAWNKYGEALFVFQIIERCPPIKAAIQHRETFWITSLLATNEDHGYNKSPNAGNQLGFRRTEESKKKQSDEAKEAWQDSIQRIKLLEANRGAKRSEATKKKMSVAATGKKQSAEHVEKSRLANLGKKHSAETKEKMAAAHRGKKRPPEVVAKIAAILKGRKMTPEQVAKISVAQKKRFEKQEERDKMSKAKRGCRGKKFNFFT